MLRIISILYLGHVTLVNTYSRGAPDTACRDHMMPRHGYDVQVSFVCFQIIDVRDFFHEIIVINQNTDAQKGIQNLYYYIL